jgi:hypothetical protein
MTRLFITAKATGVEHEVPEEKTPEYFALIELLTQLDKAMANMIMRSGQAIDSPVFSFRSDMRSGGIQ